MMVMPRLHPDALAIDAGEAPLPTLSSFATFPVDETDDRYELTLDETHDLLAPERYSLREQSMGTIYEADYYELRAPWLAVWLANDLRRYDEGRAFRLFSKHTRELTKLALPEDLDASMARCYQDQYGAYRLLLQKGQEASLRDALVAKQRGISCRTNRPDAAGKYLLRNRAIRKSCAGEVTTSCPRFAENRILRGGDRPPLRRETYTYANGSEVRPVDRTSDALLNIRPGG